MCIWLGGEEYGGAVGGDEEVVGVGGWQGGYPNML